MDGRGETLCLPRWENSVKYIQLNMYCVSVIMIIIISLSDSTVGHRLSLIFKYKVGAKRADKPYGGRRTASFMNTRRDVKDDILETFSLKVSCACALALPTLLQYNNR